MQPTKCLPTLSIQCPYPSSPESDVRRLVLLSGLAYGLFIWGLATLNGAVLALAIPLMIYLGAALFYGPEKLDLRVTRTLSSDRASQNVPVTVKLCITNEGPGLEDVQVQDLVPGALKLVDGKPCAFAALPHGETIEMEYAVQGKRGQFEFQAVQVTAGDHLGLFRQQAVIPTINRLLILPEVMRLRRVAIRPLRTRAYAGPVPARQGGAGVEFFGVREYRQGDPQRWINWRMSARHSRAIFTNEFEQERVADVGLILDARQRSDVRLKGESLFEHLVRATASLAQTFVSDGNRVGLLIYGSALDWTFPGYGKVQQESILRALARAETGTSEVFDSLDYIPTRFFPARSQLVLISPLWEDDLPALVRLRARGYQLLVISPDPIEFEMGLLGPQQPTVGLAARAARLERTLLLRRLNQAGVQIVDWKMDRPFDQTVFASLGRLPPRIHAILK